MSLRCQLTILTCNIIIIIRTLIQTKLLTQLKLTGQFTDEPTRGQSSRRLDNSWTSQFADSKFFKIMELLYFICTLNLTLTLALSNIGSV